LTGMANTSSVIAGLVTGGLGATIGSVVTAVVQVTGKRSESKAAAADLVTNAAGRMVDRLDKQNSELREAVLLLTDVLDEVMPHLDAPPEVMEKLRKAKRVAQRAV